MSYTTTIIEVGPEAGAFLAERMAITFGGNAPDELRPFCFLIEKAELAGSLAVGQRVLIGSQDWKITAMGDVAEKNLADLGHVTLVFDGEAEPRLGGAIHLSGPDPEQALRQGSQLVFGSE